MAIPFDKLPENVDKIAKGLSDINFIKKTLVLGGKDLEGRMKRRIFNKGLDTFDSSIGTYVSKSWKRKREDSGRQIAYVDLEFNGDLRRSLQVVEQGREVFLAITDDLNYKKAKGNEKRKKTVIFEPTAKEEAAVQKYIDDLIAEEIDNILSSI